MVGKPEMRSCGAWSYIRRGRSPRQACCVHRVLCAHFSMFLRDSSSKALEFRAHHIVPLHPATVTARQRKEPRPGGYLCLKKKKNKNTFLCCRKNSESPLNP